MPDHLLLSCLDLLLLVCIRQVLSCLQLLDSYVSLKEREKEREREREREIDGWIERDRDR